MGGAENPRSHWLSCTALNANINQGADMVEDLSQYGRPIGSMFRVPHPRTSGGNTRLPKSSWTCYRREGYVSGIRLLSDEQVDVLREELTPLFDPGIRATGCSTSSIQRIERYRDGSVPCAGGLADCAGVSRYPLEPGLHRAGQPIGRRRGAVLARPALLQAAAARRRRGLAPGLFVLDPHPAHDASDLLHRPGRHGPGERLPALRAGHPPLAAVADHGPGRRHGRDPNRAQRRAEGRCSGPCPRSSKRDMPRSTIP